MEPFKTLFTVAATWFFAVFMHYMAFQRDEEKWQVLFVGTVMMMTVLFFFSGYHLIAP